jgi:hypothetical protein
MKLKGFLASSALAGLVLGAGGAKAATISWADLTAANGTNNVSGTINTGSGTANVTINTGSVNYGFAQVNNAGTNYWSTGSWNGSYNKPATSDIVALNGAGTTTITFSQAVTNPYLALISWNGAVVTFNDTFSIVAQGAGYFGGGALYVPNSTNTGFTETGENDAILQFAGTLTSLTITDTVPEYWHGLTVGIGGIAPPPTGGVPEPGTWALMLLGAGAAGLALRSRRGFLPAI